MVFPAEMWIFLAVSLALCAIGFARFVWFMSVGYGLSAAGLGLTALIIGLVNGRCTPVYAILCCVTVIYGIRLGGFLLVRELKNASYREKLAQVGGEVKVPVFVSAVMGVVLGVLYVCQSAGLIYRVLNGAPDNAWLYIGTVIAATGMLLEALADQQKSAQKKTAPGLPAMQGLYRLCRCPNYFGEMTFWTGLVISGIGALQGWQWLIAAIGWVCIIFIMLSGAKRVEGRHIRNYGKLPEYQKYADSVPLLIPFVPLYHMTTPEKVAQEDAAKKEKAKKS